MQSSSNNQYDTENSNHDEWESIVSEWVDGESDIRPEDLDTPYGRQVWDTYHLIGDILRSDDLAIKPSDMFYARLSRAIDEEQTVKVAKPLKNFKWKISLSGMALAATFVGAVWLSLPYFFDNKADADIVAVNVEAVEPTEDPSLYEYFDAHTAMVGGIPARQVSYGGALQ